MGRLLGGSMVGLTATSSMNAYIIFCATQVCCWQTPCPCNRPLLICASTGDTNTQRQVWLSLCWGSLGPGAHKVLYEPSKHFWRVWSLSLNVILPLLPSCWGFSFALDIGYFFFLWDPTFSCWWLFSSELQFWRRFLLCYFVRDSPGVTGKLGLGVQNEGGQRLTEFCQENALVIANTIF